MCKINKVGTFLLVLFSAPFFLLLLLFLTSSLSSCPSLIKIFLSFVFFSLSNLISSTECGLLLFLRNRILSLPSVFFRQPAFLEAGQMLWRLWSGHRTFSLWEMFCPALFKIPRSCCPCIKETRLALWIGGQGVKSTNTDSNMVILKFLFFSNLFYTAGLIYQFCPKLAKHDLSQVS